ncbi:TonB-dependent receptor [Sphingobium sufflavum]|nr:TonB-dependent receptor [Sphingobium sufflavum]
MRKASAFGSMLLFSTALTAPALAQDAAPVQSAPTGARSQAPDTAGSASAPAEEQVEVSIPGGGGNTGNDIVVTGRYIPNIIKQTSEVVSVLSASDIARTGEGDIAGALQRVTGLSVVGEGFVYVRGLGDRYSLSLLNGSPLPSPDPLKRVVPLDIFPSSLIASGMVQKSYSPNFPGEYGGGVINLTTLSTPKESFLQVGGSVAYDTETTRLLGYTYYGSKSDWLGYDSGTRDAPGFIKEAGDANAVIPAAQAATLSNTRTTLLQRLTDTPANWSADISGGTRFDLGGVRVGVIASAGISNTWITRDSARETGDDDGDIQKAFRTVSTDNRILVNGLFGLGFEFGQHKVRLTNLYIHDTVKQGRLESGYNRFASLDPAPGSPDPQMIQGTSWAERQLYDLQGAAELRFGALSVDLRGTYANTKRTSPYEREFSYIYNVAADDYVNDLSGGSQRATIAFSDLNEDLYGAGIDVGYSLPTERSIKVTAGYAYTDMDRTSSRYFFRYTPRVSAPIAQLRPDLLLSRDVILNQNLSLSPESAAGATAYDAKLRIHAGYGMAEIELFDGFRIQGGARYETADQTVRSSGGFTPTALSNDYWLPSLTFTWNFRENMQLRLHGSKTIARPQFRELAPQQYQDFTTNRTFVGNALLQDSELKNAEGRFEWFFARDQRMSVAAFYKDISNPIEGVGFLDTSSGTLLYGFANAPKAKLYGAEVEFQKYLPLDGLFKGDLFATKRAVIIANYTYSNSELEVGNQQIFDPFPTAGAVTRVAANTVFRDGAAMTGQSDHLVNLQLGVEDTDHLSQLTLLFNYASDRVTTRGPGNQVDYIEKPGVRLDIVYRQGIRTTFGEIELKAEARNLTRTDYREEQSFSNGNVVRVNSYRQGALFSFGASMKF